MSVLTTMSLFRLFVYGTLKRGYGNHRRFCRGVLSVEPATVRGRLYELPVRFPMLVMPEEDILAHGTADPRADLAVQEFFSTTKIPVASDPKEGPWPVVYGEVLTFNDPEMRLPALDDLEGFCVSGAGFYARVLIWLNGPTWVYVGPALHYGGRLLLEGVWPPTGADK